ncbi:MAG: ABC transporter permease [Mesorhizobium amorphae]|nr:MAG: ABC transporter permease [Mesorhizobium amorphae]
MNVQLAATQRRPALSELARRCLAAVQTALGLVVGGILLALLVIVLAGATLRYGAGTGIVGTEDLGIWLHVALIAFGAPLALDSALAMRLDVLTRHMPPGGQRAADIVGDAIVLLSGLILCFGGARIVTLLGGTSPSLGLPEWVRFALLAAGGALVILVLVLKRVAEAKPTGLGMAILLAGALYLAIPSLQFATSLPPSAALFAVVALGLLAGASLPHTFLAAAYVALAFGSTLPEPAIVSAAVTGMSKFLLLAIPFFLLVGNLLTVSGTAGQIVRFASSLVGHLRAGLAQTTLLTSVLFSGASGSSVANAAFGATTFQPELVRYGYRPEQAGALIAATSVLDNVIPPSIAFLILAAATNLSVGSLLVGGFAAGGVMALCLFVAIRLVVRTSERAPKASGRERIQAGVAALPAFGLGVIVVAGIRFGVVTTTEAAALAAAYTFGLAAAARVPVREIGANLRQAGAEAAAIGLLIGTAGPFAFMLAVDDIAGLMQSFASAFGTSPLATLLAVNLALLAIGLVLDIGAAILLFGPLFLPLAVAAGIDPIHFGVILVVNLMIGGLTPPVGMLVFVVSGVTRIPATRLFAEILPFLAALLTALGVICLYALIV